MDIEVVRTCPFGHTCEEVRDNKIYRCWLYEEYGKADQQGNMIPGSSYRACTLNMQSVHLTELKKGSLGVQRAVESRMNNLIKLVEQPSIRRIANGNANAEDERQIGSDECGPQRLPQANR